MFNFYDPLQGQIAGRRSLRESLNEGRAFVPSEDVTRFLLRLGETLDQIEKPVLAYAKRHGRGSVAGVVQSIKQIDAMAVAAGATVAKGILDKQEDDLPYHRMAKAFRDTLGDLSAEIGELDEELRNKLERKGLIRQIAAYQREAKSMDWTWDQGPHVMSLS